MLNNELSAVEYLEKIEKEKKEFHEQKRYKNIDLLLGKDINTDDYNNDDWTDSVDEIFSFLYEKAYELVPFDKEVIIKYKDEYISLYEIHGQGCYRSVNSASEEDCLRINCIEYEDIISYYKTGKKPIKNKVVEVTHHALDLLEIALKGTDNDFIDIKMAKDYISKNLK